MDKVFLIFFLLLSVFLSFLAQKKDNKKFLFLTVIILSILSGFRGINVGVDTPSYYDAFINNFPKSWQFQEVGFRFIVNFLMNYLSSPTYVMFVFSFIINYFILNRLWDFRYKTNLPFMIFIYSFTFFIDSMNIMRQLIAISFIFYFTRYLDKNKYLLFTFVVILCYFIHSTAILGLLFLFISLWDKLSYKKRILFLFPLVLMLIFSFFFMIKSQSGHITNYFSDSNFIMNFNLTFVFRLFIFLFSYILNCSNKKIIFSKIGFNVKESSFIKTDNYFNYVALFYFFGLCCSSLGMFFSYMSRIGYYYLIYELVYWGYLSFNNKNKWINVILISLYVIYVFILEMVRNGSAIFPFYLNII